MWERVFVDGENGKEGRHETPKITVSEPTTRGREKLIKAERECTCYRKWYVRSRTPSAIIGSPTAHRFSGPVLTHGVGRSLQPSRSSTGSVQPPLLCVCPWFLVFSHDDNPPAAELETGPTCPNKHPHNCLFPSEELGYPSSQNVVDDIQVWLAWLDDS